MLGVQFHVTAIASYRRLLRENTVFRTANFLSRASVGVSAAVESPDLADDLLAKADAQLRALAAVIDDEEALPEELQGVEAAPAPETDDADEEEQADEDTADTDDAEAADDDADDDGDDGGEGLGAMFG